ncbi:hypothetical protein J3Q64DRAFT_1703640 [Phycomyces blakesleeanus]|uniref:PIPK domain-containing protein n=1 Tax=Phycomyces blakesleeanus TaxID=4837 RepID=A0ABR3ANJ3_PHYBL
MKVVFMPLGVYLNNYGYILQGTIENSFLFNIQAMSSTPPSLTSSNLRPPSIPFFTPEMNPNQAMLPLDVESRAHLWKLLNVWLAQEQVPTSPWAHVLMDIGIKVSDELVMTRQKITVASMATNVPHEAQSGMFIQAFSCDTASHSRYIPDAHHGDLLSSLLPDLPWHALTVSGLIRLYGVPTWATLKISKIMAATIYVLHSLTLEIHVMRDHHINLVSYSPDPPVVDVQQLDPDPEPVIPEKHTMKFKPFGWLWPRKKSTADPPKQKPRRGSHFIPRLSISKKPDGLASSGDTAVSLSGGLSFKSFRRNSQEYQSKESNQPGPIASDLDHYSKMHKQFEMAVVSSSPDCSFSVPSIILKLEAEEENLNVIRSVVYDTQQPQQPLQPIMPSKLHLIRRASSLFLGQRRKVDGEREEDPPQKSFLLPSIVLPQSVEAYSLLRIPESVRDHKLGLDHLLLENNTLDSFVRHQQMTLAYTCYPVGCPDRPCIGPILCKTVYFDYHLCKDDDLEAFHPTADQPLGKIIEHWCNRSQEACKHRIEERFSSPDGQPLAPALVHQPSLTFRIPPDSPSLEKGSPLAQPTNKPETRKTIFHECSQPMLDHILRFAQAKHRVDVYLCQEDGPNTPETVSTSVHNITIWMTCNVCDATTAPVPMSTGTYNYSFSKYLELMFYSKRFVAPSTLCSHANSRKAITRCFRLGSSAHSITVKMAYETTNVYNLNAPQIQVVPDEIVARPVDQEVHFDLPPAISEVPPSRSSRLSEAVQKRWRGVVEQEINGFFDAIARHLVILQNSLMASLAALKKTLLIDKEEFMHELGMTDGCDLNDYRRSFSFKTTSLLQRLSEWQHEHDIQAPECVWDAPEYVRSKQIHCFPSSSILVREDEPSSIIAYTLSSGDYVEEMKLESAPFRKTNCERSKGLKRSDTIKSNDSIRSNGTQRTTLKSTDIPLPTMSSFDSTDNMRDVSKAAIEKTQLSNQPNVVDGYYSTIERKYIAPSTGAASETASFRTMVMETFKINVDEARNSSHGSISGILKNYLWTPTAKEPVTPSEKEDLERQMSVRVLDTKTTEKATAPMAANESTKEIKLSSYFHGRRSSHQTLGLSLVNEPDNKVMSPHLKHKFVHETMEFTCVVYYAKEFEGLRKQCGIDQLFLQSLSRCQGWAIGGGKSKSHFYKTRDDRLIVKEMVNAWNLTEKDTFLKFAPKYFDAMKQCAEAPSLLTKIFGFYTIRMRSLEDKKVFLNIDVLVMEHLFYGQSIIKRFDFKGIQDRRMEESRKEKSVTTLWDGDWVNDYRMEFPIHEQARALLKEAIERDTEFLMKSNIMDYSLLVGIDEQKQELSVGLVDFIGTFTWYKMIESKSKLKLQPHKEVTVLPPELYRARFCREVSDYFVAIPGNSIVVIAA